MSARGLSTWTRCDDALSVVILGSKPLELQLVGELDVVNTDAVHEVLASCAIAGESVVLDLHTLTFIDAAGVRALERLADALDGGRLILMNPSEIAHRLLTLTGIAGRANVRLDDPWQSVPQLSASPAGRH